MQAAPELEILAWHCIFDDVHVHRRILGRMQLYISILYVVSNARTNCKIEDKTIGARATRAPSSYKSGLWIAVELSNNTSAAARTNPTKIDHELHCHCSARVLQLLVQCARTLKRASFIRKLIWHS